MLQPYEVFDAPTERLQEELRHLQANMVNATAQQTPGLMRLRSIIEQELEERGGAEELFDGLQELEDFLGSAGAYLDQLDQEDDADAAPSAMGGADEEDPEEVARSPSSTTSFGPTVSSRTHSPERERGDGDTSPPPRREAAPPPASPSPPRSVRRGPASESSFVEDGMGMWGAVPGAPAGQRVTAESSQPGSEEAAAAESPASPDGGQPDGGQPDEAPKEAPPKVVLTPVEAAMLAYKAEQRQLAKARKARDEKWGFQQGGAKPKLRKDIKVSAPGALPWSKPQQKSKRSSTDGTAPPTRQPAKPGPDAGSGRPHAKDPVASVARTKPTALEASRSLKARVEGRNHDRAGPSQAQDAPAEKKPAAVERAASARPPSVSQPGDDRASPSLAVVSPRARSESGALQASVKLHEDPPRAEYLPPELREEVNEDEVELPPEIGPDRAWEEPEDDDNVVMVAVTGPGIEDDDEEEEALEAPDLDDAHQEDGEADGDFDPEEITGVEVAHEPARSFNGSWESRSRTSHTSSLPEPTPTFRDGKMLTGTSYIDPSDEEEEYGQDDDGYSDDDGDDFEIYDDPDGGQSDTSEDDSSRGELHRGPIGYVSSVPEATVGGPTRIVMRPDSADNADDRRYASALADFGIGGDANGGVSAWGDGADEPFMMGPGRGGAPVGAGAARGPSAWLFDDSDDEAQEAAAPQAPMLGYDAKPGLPIVGPLAAPRPTSSSPQRPASRARAAEMGSSPASSDAGTGSTSGSPLKPPVAPSRPKTTRMNSARGYADRRQADDGPQYHYTYGSFAEIFTEFSSIQANAQLAAQAPSDQREGESGGNRASPPARAASPNRPGSRPGSARRHDSGAVWDRTQKTTERCCRWLEHHQELWPAKEEINDAIARSSPYHISRWFRVACSAGHPEVFKVVSAAMELAGGWEEDVVDGPSPASSMPPLPVHVPKCFMWNLMWTWSAKVPVPYNELMVWQKVNHFPDARQLTRKDLLKRHLHRHHKMLKGTRGAAVFNIMPPTFNLPKEYSSWVEAFGKGVVESSSEGGNLWIIKPVGLSRGRGISIASRIDNINHGEHVVVQKYIPRPLLIDGYKFDIRLYVLVTSFNPLEAWLYKEGFARFASEKYTTNPESLDNLYVHLTNSSIQKHGGSPLPDKLVGGGTSSELYGGSKCTLTHMWKLLEEMGIERSKIWKKITEEVLAALFAVQGSIPHNSNSFELYGFDVLITRSQKVWLIEANSSPSMGCDTPLDLAVKPVLVRDIISVVEPPVFDRVALAEVLQRRLTKKGRARGGESSLMAGTGQDERYLLNRDLNAVLRGKMPREYGVMPEAQGAFERVAPSKAFDEIKRLVKAGPRA